MTPNFNRARMTTAKRAARQLAWSYPGALSSKGRARIQALADKYGVSPFSWPYLAIMVEDMAPGFTLDLLYATHSCRQYGLVEIGLQVENPINADWNLARVRAAAVEYRRLMALGLPESLQADLRQRMVQLNITEADIDQILA